MIPDGRNAHYRNTTPKHEQVWVDVIPADVTLPSNDPSFLQTGGSILEGQMGCGIGGDVILSESDRARYGHDGHSKQNEGHAQQDLSAT